MSSRISADTFDLLDEKLFRREARIDNALTFADIDRAFLDAHELLQPFGAGNPQPLFLARNVRVAGRREFGEGCCEMTLEDATGRAVAVLWPSANALDPIFSNGTRSDVVFQIEPDAYAASGARLTLVDARNSIDQ
jgi:single-stranded DNA-specific DHH superfamily exonuclease